LKFSFSIIYFSLFEEVYKTYARCSVWYKMCMFLMVIVGILIVVAVGVALGVFLGGTMLLLASMLMKR